MNYHFCYSWSAKVTLDACGLLRRVVILVVWEALSFVGCKQRGFGEYAGELGLVVSA
jgi:hypothetical protein